MKRERAFKEKVERSFKAGLGYRQVSYDIGTAPKARLNPRHDVGSNPEQAADYSYLLSEETRQEIARRSE